MKNALLLVNYFIINRASYLIRSLFILRLFVFILLSSLMTSSFAKDSPKNQLQIDYQNSLTGIDFFDYPFLTVYQIPEATYHYLNSAFSRFYRTVTFNTSIKDSTFAKSNQYEIISIPFVAANSKYFQFEVFGKLTDSEYSIRSEMTKNNVLYQYNENSDVLDVYNSTIALGAGFSFHTSPFSKVKVLFSNESLPGYGNSQALIGFESEF